MFEELPVEERREAATVEPVAKGFAFLSEVTRESSICGSLGGVGVMRPRWGICSGIGGSSPEKALSGR